MCRFSVARNGDLVKLTNYPVEIWPAPQVRMMARHPPNLGAEKENAPPVSVAGRNQQGINDKVSKRKDVKNEEGEEPTTPLVGSPKLRE